MNLAQTRIGFPVLRLKVRVYHSTPRPPTAFERVLLKLCDRFGSNTDYNNIGVVRIFEDILGVADPAALLQPTLQELLMLDVLRCQADISAADRLGLRDLEITPRGRQMLSDDMLPARSQENDEDFFFDPVRKLLLSGTEAKVLRPEAPAVVLDAGVFQDVFPEEIIRQDVLRGSYSWWNAASRIERIERQSTSILWREATADIALDKDSVRVVLSDGEQTNYVSSLPGEEVYRRILVPTLLGEDALAAKASQFPLYDLGEEPDSAHSWVPIQQALSDFPGADGVWLVDRASELVRIPEESAPRQAIICFDQSSDSDEVCVTWNKARNGCIVALRGAFPLPRTVLASLKQLIGVYRVRVRVGREHYEVPLACRTATATENTGVADALATVTAMVRAQDDDGKALAPALWMGEADFWQAYMDGLSVHPGSLVETLTRLIDVRKEYIHLVGRMDAATWDNAVARAITSQLSSPDGKITLSELDSLMSIIAQCKVVATESDSAVRQKVLDRIVLPETLHEFGKISTAVRRGGPSWKVAYPSRFYTPGIFASVASEFGGSAVGDCLPNSNEFDQSVRSLQQGYQAVNESVGASGLAGLSSDDARVVLLKSRNAERIAELAETWSRQYGVFLEKFPDMGPHLATSALEVTADRIHAIASLMQNRTTLLTNDNNLALKARAENIAVMKAGAFDQRPRGGMAVSDSGQVADRGQAKPVHTKQAKKPRRSV